jgi:hypothetical protein
VYQIQRAALVLAVFIVSFFMLRQCATQPMGDARSVKLATLQGKK